MNFLAIQLCGA